MYKIDKDHNILLYGYSNFDLVRDKYKELKAAGYKVLGFLDKNAPNLRRTEECQLWLPDELPLSGRERKQTAVIILLQNGRIHEGIAAELQASGFDKILFLPENLGTERQKIMYRKYNLFLEGSFDELEGIPDYRELREVLEQDTIFLEERDGYCTAAVPVELVFSYWEEKAGLQNIKYDRRYRELFDYLTGQVENCFCYLEFMGVEGNRAEVFIRDRAELYTRFESERNRGMDFFRICAPYASWNPNGYFHIVDGHHRAAYLAYHDILRIPLRMKKEDYGAWENRMVLKGCPDTVSCPVPHPCFGGSMLEFEPHWGKVTGYLFRIMEERGTVFGKFVESGGTLGYYARYLDRLGWAETFICAKNREQRDMIIGINRLLNQNIPVLTEEEELQTCSVAYLEIGEQGDSILNRILETGTTEILILELPERRTGYILPEIEDKMRTRAALICRRSHSGITYRIYGIRKIQEGKSWQKL